MTDCANSEPYALQVTDTSMEPEFPEGCVVVVEPNAPLENGCYVIAEPVGQVLTFRQLFISGSELSLRALRDDIEDIPISNFQEIRGRVIQRAGKRRKDRKTYC